ncbi:tyrosine-type recombinase/integrase [Emticicia sp. BO119]|uniref:tyrosine-type recombinase/integrase n=1 Tax=Emticicia sp. BO119 TaxID=2757768 RepID=UPI0015F0D63E|nr:tyrosine-type recombinase/integrase [Emticicia sp. BO119]MBA4850024.1 tyrosine-type recombinase/integrase [Emticicia sp. BO119]
MTHLIERFTEILKKGKYNSQTIAAYRNAIFVFYNHFRDLPQSKITEELISNYLIELSEKKGGSTDASKQAGKAIKLFFEVIFKRKLGIKASGEMKEDTLPEILTENEVESIIGALDNPKHKALMATIYAMGLKLSDILIMKVNDLDMETKLIMVPPSKTDKGRKLKIPNKLIPILMAYFDKHKPKELLFVGEKGKPYSPRSVQLVFQQALVKAKIEKNATVHTLRHSYAVHCLERGIDIHLLKEILGHKYLQTTSMYYQIAQIDLANIRSPFEDLEF